MTSEDPRAAIMRVAASPNNLCFGCGPGNPHGLHLQFQEEDGVVFTTFIPGEWHQGWQGVVHGGILAAVLDEAMAYCLFFRGILGVTARFETRYRQAVHGHDELRIEAQLVRQVRKVWDIEARILRAGEVVVEGTGRFISGGALRMAGVDESP